MNTRTYDRIIAGVATTIIVALLFIWLFMSGMRMERAELAESSIAEYVPQDEEETFIEPEPVIEDKGEEDAPELPNQQEAPTERGEPERVETPQQESQKVVVPGTNTKPAPQREQPVTQRQPSPVQSTPSPKTEQQPSKVSSTMANQFSGQNGKPDGKTGGAGTGGKGTAAVNGTSKGRKMDHCPSPDVALKKREVVVVNVMINEQGRVESAKATGSAPDYIKKACINCAKSSKWTPKPGAGVVAGTITFTITPVH